MLDPGSIPHRILPLEVRGLSYVVDGKKLIDHIDCALMAETRTVILGPNGAGKSLLLRLLHGLIDPTSGQILWGGKSAGKQGRNRQAMVFQSPVLLRRSAIDNILFALKAAGASGSDIRRFALDALELAGLAALANIPARRLSGGEQQKLAIARAVASEPEILFLDEPTASLDPASTFAVEEMINAASHRGVKIVLVTHDIAQARRMADHVMFVHQGSIVEDGPANSFFGQTKSGPARDYLAGRLIPAPLSS